MQLERVRRDSRLPCGMSKKPTPVMFALPLRSVKRLEEG
jgi:hypothetical protein